MRSTLASLAENLRRYQAEKGLQQNEMAYRFEMSPTYLSQLLAETNQNPDLRKLEKIAEKMGTTVGRLLSDPDAPAGHTIQDCYRAIGRALSRAD